MNLKKKINYKKIIFIITVLLLIYFIVSLVVYAIARKNISAENEALVSSLDNNLSYDIDKREDDFAYVDEILSRSFLTDEQKGLLYERKAFLYNLDEEPLNYFKYAAYAAYYLNNAKNYDKQVNLYCDLAKYYLFHDAKDKAELMLDKADEIVAAADRAGVGIQDVMIFSYYYRVSGMIATANEDYTSAHELFGKAIEEAQKSTIPEFVEHYTAMVRLQEMMCLILEGETETVSQEIEEYEPMDLDVQSVYKQVLISDYQMPYYEVHIKLAAANDDIVDINKYINEYISYCKKYNYYQKRLDVWTIYVDTVKTNGASNANDLYSKTLQTYNEVTHSQSDDFVKFIDVTFQDNYDQLVNADSVNKHNQTSNTMSLIGVLVSLFVLVILYKLYVRANTDSLTGLKNRNCFDKNIGKLAHNNECRSGFMIDIDNFKSINDTYGHEMGDLVLKQIGKIILEKHDSNFIAFRYGGEELIVISKNNDLQFNLDYSDRIRKKIADFDWPQEMNVTVSIGLAIHCQIQDLVATADHNLYYTKTHGKNNVCYLKEGKETLLHNGN